eukprot:3593834-Prorocentrum_lima.AAC.1
MSTVSGCDVASRMAWPPCGQPGHIELPKVLQSPAVEEASFSREVGMVPQRHHRRVAPHMPFDAAVRHR